MNAVVDLKLNTTVSYLINEQLESRKNSNSLAGELIYTMDEVTLAVVHAVSLLCLVASSFVA